MVWKIIYMKFSHPGGYVSLEGVRKSGSISCKLPDDPGGSFMIDRIFLSRVPLDLSTQTECYLIKYRKLRQPDFVEKLHFSACFQHVSIQKSIFPRFTLKNIFFFVEFCF